MATSLVSIKHGAAERKLAVCHGIPPQEISQSIRASFGLSRPIVGFEDRERGVIYPLSLLSLDPSCFLPSVSFSLLLDPDVNNSNNNNNNNAPVPSAAPARDAKKPESEEEVEEPQEPILEYIQQNTAFSRIPMNEILAVFRDASKEGVIDRNTFERCFQKVCKGDGQDQKILKLVAHRVFDVFDRDGNGIVDHSEFVAGLSLLCRASSEDKIQAAFNLFDLDGDGYVTYDEMLRYMISFFDVCFALDSNMKKRFGNITAEQVGTATANHCFVRADANGDGHISFEEFRDWCNSDDSVARSGIIPQTS